MRNKLLISLIALTCLSWPLSARDFIRGIVYDVGLMYGGSSLSVKDFNPEQVEYDMNVISDILRCNAVRIEGEDIDRLTAASEIAHEQGLRIFFNPWKMGADPEETASYMAKAAKAAEILRKRGFDITFVAGCEYTLFSKGAFPGETFDERFKWLVSLGESGKSKDEIIATMTECNNKLNSILGNICAAVRAVFSGPITYSSGVWEQVDWNMFDIIALDHYRHGENDAEYMAVIERLAGDKPVVVLETGCCTYKGAAKRGGEGFAIFQGTDADGNGIYEGGAAPERSESEQAQYVAEQIQLLSESPAADGVFIFVFRYPIYPYSNEGIDYDLTSYALVKSFKDTDPRSHRIPAWEPKEAFFRLGELYTRLSNQASK